MMSSALALNHPFHSMPNRNGETPEKLEIKRSDAVNGEAPAKIAQVMAITEACTRGEISRSGICWSAPSISVTVMIALMPMNENINMIRDMHTIRVALLMFV